MKLDIRVMRPFSGHFSDWFAPALAMVTAVTIGAPLFAQTPLADVARKEAERRKSQPPAAKVYTNKDLPESAQKPAAPPPTSAPAGEPGAAPEQAQEQKPPAQPDEQKTEAWWKSRMAQAHEELRRNEIFAESLQSRINALTREYALPISGARRVAVGEQRAEAIAELGRVKQEVERGKKQIADIEEEARKAGVPPGWLR